MFYLYLLIFPPSRFPPDRELFQVDCPIAIGIDHRKPFGRLLGGDLRRQRFQQALKLLEIEMAVAVAIELCKVRADVFLAFFPSFLHRFLLPVSAPGFLVRHRSC